MTESSGLRQNQYSNQRCCGRPPGLLEEENLYFSHTLMDNVVKPVLCI